MTPIHIQTPHGKPAERSSPPPAPEKEANQQEVEPRLEPEETESKEDPIDSVLMEGVGAKQFGKV